ncbi:MAG: YfhO family protein [Sphingomonadaceae bacterium]
MLRAAAVLFLAAAAPFARQLLAGAGILDEDVFTQSLPAWEWLSRTLRSGDSFLWAPEVMGGFPIAFTQYPFLYPPDLLLARLLPGAHAYAWSIVLHMALAGSLTFAYCRFVGLGTGPALLAALSYQLSSEVVAGSSGFAARSAFVLPGILLAVESTLTRGAASAPWVTPVVAAALLGGHPQLVLMGLLAGAIYAPARILSLAPSRGYRWAAYIALMLALAASLGAAGAAARLLPTWEVVSLSTRAGSLPDSAAASGALSVQGLLVGYLLPLSRLQDTPWGAPGYAGPAVLILAGLSVRYLVSHPLGRVFVGLGTLTALLSLGDATPLHAITRLPFLSLFREPSRFTLVTTFCLSVLGGIALNGLVRYKSNTWSAEGALRRILPIAIATAAATAGLFLLGLLFQFGTGASVESMRIWVQSHSLDALNPLRPRMALALSGVPAVVLLLALSAAGRISARQLQSSLILVSAAVLIPVAAILNPPIEVSVIGRIPDTVGILEERAEGYRVFGHRTGTRIYNHTHFFGPSREEGFTDDLRYRYAAEMMAPILNLRWGLDSPDGYEQLHSRYQEALLKYIDSEQASYWYPMSGRWGHLSMEERLRVLSMLNVKYILSGTELASEAPSLVPITRIEVPPGPNSRAPMQVHVLENPNPFPRYYLVSAAATYGSDTEALEAVALGEVDPRRTVILGPDTGAVPDAAKTEQQPDSRQTAEGTVRLLSKRNTEVTVAVSTDEPAFLVTSDAYWPGWRAFVDGHETPVMRANVGGRAIRLEAGTHLVTFHFQPPLFTFGLVVSVTAIIAWCAWLGLSRLSRRSALKAASPSARMR